MLGCRCSAAFCRLTLANTSLARRACERDEELVVRVGYRIRRWLRWAAVCMRCQCSQSISVSLTSHITYKPPSHHSRRPSLGISPRPPSSAAPPRRPVPCPPMGTPSGTRSGTTGTPPLGGDGRSPPRDAATPARLRASVVGEAKGCDGAATTTVDGGTCTAEGWRPCTAMHSATDDNPPRVVTARTARHDRPRPFLPQASTLRNAPWRVGRAGAPWTPWPLPSSATIFGRAPC